MNSTELLTLLRTEIKDDVEPYMMGDAVLYSYLDDAQSMFCRLTEGIEDSRTAGITDLSVVSGTAWYPISKLILKLRSVTRLADGAVIEVVNSEMAHKKGLRFDAKVGPLACFVTGLQKNELRAWPVPNQDAEFTLSVFRLPLVPITDVGDQEMEIDAQHHRHLLNWVKRLVYDNHDTELFDRRRSDEYGQRFEAYCARARVEQERGRRTVGTVLYGGI